MSSGPTSPTKTRTPQIVDWIEGYLSNPSTQTTESKPPEASQDNNSQASQVEVLANLFNQANNQDSQTTSPPRPVKPEIEPAYDYIGTTDYGFVTLNLLRYRPTNRWFFTYTSGKHEKDITVYQGDISVEVVHDKLLKQDVYVARTENGVVFDFDINELTRKLLGRDRNIVNQILFEPFLRTLIRYSKVKDGYVIGGFYPDGFDEGVIEPYPAVAWGCRPKSLEEVIKHIVTNYPVGNRAFALANVALALGKVFGPAIRFARNQFEDRVVINTGVMRIGKTKLFESIINLLGLDHERVYVNGDLSVKTPERIRNLLMDVNAPLFVDDIGVKGFEAFSNIVLSVISGGTVGLQANKIGFGFVAKFKVLRSMLISTNITEGKIREVLSKDEVTAWVRRVIVLPWAEEPLPKGVNEWTGEPINECLRDMWNMRQVREALIGLPKDIIELSRYVVDAFRRLYNVDTKPLLEALRIVEKVSEESEEEVVRRHRPEDVVVSRIYEIARQALGVTNITVYQALRAMYENPGKFDIRVTGSMDEKKIESDLRDWEALARELGYVPEDLGRAPDDEDGGFDKLSDTEKALAFVWWLIEEKRLNRVIIYANSEHGLMQGAPKHLFGSPRGIYNGRKGYSVSWVDILRKLLNLPPQAQEQSPTQAKQAKAQEVETEEATEKT